MERVRWSDLLRHGRAVYTVILNLAIALHAIDVFIVAAVMPTVVRDIGGARYYAWATMLYMIASIVGAASGGPAKAALGTRKAYVAAGIGFAIGTAAAGAAPTMLILLIARTVQGYGGGLLLSQSMGLVGELYPADLRTRILALVSGIWGVAALVGPMIGGLFAEFGWWRGAFWSTVPIILCFVALAWRTLPEGGRAAVIPRFPWRRLGLLALGVIAVGLTSDVENPLLQVLLLVMAAILVVLTVRLDTTSANRLLPSRLLSLSRPVSVGFFIFFLLSLTHTAIGVFLPLALQVLHGETPLVAAYSNAVLAISWTASSFVVAGWRGRLESASMIAGPLLAAVALVLLAIGIAWLHPVLIAVLTGTIGFGIGMSNLHITSWTMRLADPGEESITASSIPMIRSLGIAFGAAGSGAIANAAGLAHGISVETVSRAMPWVYATAMLAPAGATLLALRFLALRRKVTPA